MEETNKEDLIRAFICVTISDDAIKEVARVQEVLANKMFTGKMTELENLHLTLKFLGEISKEQVEKIKEKLKEVKFKPFEAKLGLAGTFGRRGNPRIVWVKVNGDELWKLQKQVDDAVKDFFKPEQEFMSHMTVARVKFVKNRGDFIDYVKNIKVKEVKFKVGSFKLMSSDLRSSGPVYTVLEEYKSQSEKLKL